MRSDALSRPELVGIAHIGCGSVRTRTRDSSGDPVSELSDAPTVIDNPVRQDRHNRVLKRPPERIAFSRRV